MLDQLRPWISSPDYIITEPPIGFLGPTEAPYFGFEKTLCPYSKCSSRAWCVPFYKALFEVIGLKLGIDPEWSKMSALSLDHLLAQYYGGISAPNPFLSCPIYLKPTQTYPYQDSRCTIFSGDPITASEFNISDFYDQLLLFRDGGLDRDWIRWPGLGTDTTGKNKTLVGALGQQMMDILSYTCDLRSPCRVPLRCDEVGSRTALGLSGRVWRSRWGYFALIAIQNLNTQLANQFSAIDGAGIRAILDAFTIDNYWPHPNPVVDLSNALGGLSAIFSIASGVLPALSAAAEVGAGAIGAFASFYSSRLSANLDPNAGQKLFVPQLRIAYETMVSSLYESTNRIFNDSNVGGVSLIDLIRDGQWISADRLQPLPDIAIQLKRELISHALDGLWKTPTSNKMWVLYVNNVNTQITCDLDRSGPQITKYCDPVDEFGVYYTYNFIEKGDHRGIVGLPWGGDKFDQLDLQLNVGSLKGRIFNLL